MVATSGSDIERLVFSTPGDIEILRENTFGWLESEGSAEERIIRLAALLPMWLSFENEARETIARLREENAELRLSATRGSVGDALE